MMIARRRTSSCPFSLYPLRPIDPLSQLNLLITLLLPDKLKLLSLFTHRHIVTRPVLELHLLGLVSEAEAYLVEVVVGGGPKTPDNVVRPAEDGKSQLEGASLTGSE